MKAHPVLNQALLYIVVKRINKSLPLPRMKRWSTSLPFMFAFILLWSLHLWWTRYMFLVF